MKVTGVLLSAAFLVSILTANAQEDGGWATVEIPSSFEKPNNDHGFVWFRCKVRVPQEWEGSRLLLIAGEIDGVDEAFFNGRKIGANGAMPPLYHAPASSVRRPFVVEPDWVRFGDENFIAWRVFNPSGTTGILSGPVHLTRKEDAIDLQGEWQMREGDSNDWSQLPDEKEGKDSDQWSAVFGDVIPADLEHREKMIAAVYKKFEGNPNPYARNDDKGEALAAEDARDTMIPGEGLEVDTVLSEPIITQPLYVDFDERGRMWVVQYIQYPDPAGLEVLTWDNHLRKVFDKVPPPPPYDIPEKEDFAGRDRISIHEDTNGDGKFDTHKVFLDRLNLATSVARGRGGVWVMQPPYLLFYADANNDDIPDDAPVVHLSGFGLEDTHSIANSLKWGRDGWLYGGVGSTVTARVRAHLSGSDRRHSFFGQNIWRYHPDSHVFELFAEGGWNTFGVDFDDKGQLYSGTNGNQQAVHFVQGGFYQKSFGKHGPHTKPYVFGHFNGMPIEGEKIRMVHQWIYYNSGSIPSLEGMLVGGNALASKLHALKMSVSGSTFETVEMENPLRTDHKWFRPVHCTVGPDGRIYVSDFYDARITHVDPRDNWDRDRGRIYRLRASEDPGDGRVLDLSKLSAEELVDQLESGNQWARRTAQRILADRGDASVLPLLLERLRADRGPLALEALWAINGIGEFTDAVALEAMAHADPHVRSWGVRLTGDPKATLMPQVFEKVLSLAREEDEARVVSQVASTTARLPSPQALAIIAELSKRDTFAGDPFIPQQIWWALEEQITRDPLRSFAMFEQLPFWESRLVRGTLAERIGRRFMSERNSANLEYCAKLLDQATTQEVSEALVRGMALALEGTSLAVVPAELDAAIAKAWNRSPDSEPMIDFALRLRSEKALGVARSRIADFTADEDMRIRFIRTLSQMEDSNLVPILLRLVVDGELNPALRLAALNGLRRFSDAEIPDAILRTYPEMSNELQRTAQGILASRIEWSNRLLLAVEKGGIPAESIAYDTLLVIQSRNDRQANALIKKHWEDLRQPEKVKADRMNEVRKILAGEEGNAERGQQVFATSCGICHRLGDVGRAIAPDLTGYERGNLDFLLPAIVDPNLGVREEFELVTVTLRSRDGKPATVLSGFVSESSKHSITVRDLAGNDTLVSVEDVVEKVRAPVSIMPEGLLDTLSVEQVRDLFAFLQKQ